jgi:hypothetical protein
MLNVPSAIAFNVSLRGHGIGRTLFGMSKSDHLSIILLSVNAGLPLVALIAVAALMLRNMALG